MTPDHLRFLPKPETMLHGGAQTAGREERQR